MAGANDVINGAVNAGKAMDKAIGIKDTAESGKKAFDTITDPNARTSDKINDSLDFVTTGVNSKLPPGVEIPESFNENMHEFNTGVENAMDGKTPDGKDLNTYNKEKERKYGEENNTDNSANETASNGNSITWPEHVNSGKFDKQAETEFRQRIYDDDLQKRLDNLKLPMGGEDRTKYDAEKKAINDEQDLREFERGKKQNIKKKLIKITLNLMTIKICGKNLKKEQKTCGIGCVAKTKTIPTRSKNNGMTKTVACRLER